MNSESAAYGDRLEYSPIRLMGMGRWDGNQQSDRLGFCLDSPLLISKIPGGGPLCGASERASEGRQTGKRKRMRVIDAFCAVGMREKRRQHDGQRGCVRNVRYPKNRTVRCDAEMCVCSVTTDAKDDYYNAQGGDARRDERGGEVLGLNAGAECDA